MTLAWAAAPQAYAQLPLSTLAPAGPASASIATIWWAMLIGSTAIYVLVLALATYAVMRKQRDGTAPVRLLVIGGGLVLPTVVVILLLVYGLRSGQAWLPSASPPAYRVDVTAHQWWWAVSYPEPALPGAPVANEIHIPSGVPVDVYLTSADVIHSFWVPRLGGKMDALPGRTTVLRIQADHPGVYHGICAEFCGAQHAHMQLIVHAHAGLIDSAPSAAAAGGTGSATP